jgi:hypothetical protein
MTAQRFSYVNDAWTYQQKEDRYVSPALKKGRLEQIALADEEIADGSIAATVTALGGLVDEHYPKGRIEAAILFRYTKHDSCYCAGLGAYGKKYFIARVSQVLDKGWQELDLLAKAGDGGSLSFRKDYHLRVEFMGRHIKLFESGVEVLSVPDDTHPTGEWGLKTFKTQARFASIAAVPERRCFVAMPISNELDGPYGVIKRTVEEWGLKCIRADGIFKPRPAIENIKAEIAGANLVIIDFTGKKPNVYYEAGMVDALNKPWIILAQSQDDLEFDVRGKNAIVYSSDGLEKLEGELVNAMQQTMGQKVRSRQGGGRYDSGASRSC